MIASTKLTDLRIDMECHCRDFPLCDRDCRVAFQVSSSARLAASERESRPALAVSPSR